MSVRKCLLRATVIAVLTSANGCAQVEPLEPGANGDSPFEAADLGRFSAPPVPEETPLPPKPEPSAPPPRRVDPDPPSEVVVQDAGASPGVVEVDGAAPPPLPPPEAEPPAPSEGPCEGLDFYGECNGSVVRYCDGGFLVEFDCAWFLSGCGWVDDSTGYYCGGQGARPDGERAPPADRPPEAPPANPRDQGECGDAFETRVVELVNRARARNGLGALQCDAAGVAAAQAHSADQCAMRNMSHTGSDGSDAGQRLRRAGARFGGWGENVAWGADSAEDVHDMWMNSRGHYRNIMGGFSRIGVGYDPCGGRAYWTEVFLD